MKRSMGNTLGFSAERQGVQSASCFSFWSSCSVQDVTWSQLGVKRLHFSEVRRSEQRRPWKRARYQVWHTEYQIKPRLPCLLCAQLSACAEVKWDSVETVRCVVPLNLKSCTRETEHCSSAGRLCSSEHQGSVLESKLELPSVLVRSALVPMRSTVLCCFIKGIMRTTRFGRCCNVTGLPSARVDKKQ